MHNPGELLYGRLPGFRLSPLGKSQAAALGRRIARLPLVAVYSSPLERAVETAAIAAGRTPATVDELLDWEPDPTWVGKPWADIPSLDPDAWQRFADQPWIDALPAARAVRAIAAAHPGADVLVVGHQDPLRAVMNELRQVPTARLRDDPLPHCALRSLDPRTWKVVARWNPPASSSWPAGTF